MHGVEFLSEGRGVMKVYERARAIVLTPRAEWPSIAGERATLSNLFVRYVAILALIPAIALFLGSSIIGGFTTFGSGFVRAVIGYVLTFAAVYITGLIVDAIAPSFEAVRNFPNAMKLAVYAHTPFWLAGVFFLVPGLTFLTVLGLYGFWLLWTGMPLLMQASSEKLIPYALTVVAVAVVLALLTWIVPGPILNL
jgi:hypothetical protein